MKNKKLKRAVFAIGVIISVLLVLWLILSLSIDCKFLDVELPDWITIFGGFEIAFFITYYLTNVKTDYEKRIETYAEIITKMQNRLHEDPLHLFSKSMLQDYEKKWEFYQKELLLYFKALWNYYNLIKQYKGDLDIEKELNFVHDHLEQYDFELTANASSFESIKIKRAIVRREIDLIDITLDELKLKLH